MNYIPERTVKDMCAGVSPTMVRDVREIVTRVSPTMVSDMTPMGVTDHIYTTYIYSVTVTVPPFTGVVCGEC